MRCIQRRALLTSTVVAELRPSADSDARRLRSLAAVVWWSPQQRQNRNLPGRNHTRRPEPALPLGSTRKLWAFALL
ncbi:MAG: hypothetical protein QM765_51425 [Myxococcales bacterium]